MKKPADPSLTITADYRRFIQDLKNRVAAARISIARRINHELILLYWDIGRGIVEKQKVLGWGESVVEMVAADLRKAFPSMTGFSSRNVWYMRGIYEAYSDPQFISGLMEETRKGGPGAILQQPVAELGGGRKSRKEVGKIGKILEPGTVLQQLVAEIPWGQHITIIEKLAAPAARLWYLREAARFGWSRNVLLNQIKASAYERALTKKKTHNFNLALPADFAEQAEEILKSSYSLDFLGLRRAVRERELEDRLVGRLQAFLLELGYGFCFIGRQHRITLGRKEYFIDLLFYHRFLKALVAFELKVGPFEPEHAGQMDFYLNLLNDKERGPGDQPPIGIILCAEKDDIEVEYALRTKTNPIGVAAYRLQSKLPSSLKGRLPSAKQLAELVRSEMETGK